MAISPAGRQTQASVQTLSLDERLARGSGPAASPGACRDRWPFDLIARGPSGGAGDIVGVRASRGVLVRYPFSMFSRLVVGRLPHEHCV
jgi:hypothetical protein